LPWTPSAFSWLLMQGMTREAVRRNAISHRWPPPGDGRAVKAAGLPVCSPFAPRLLPSLQGRCMQLEGAAAQLRAALSFPGALLLAPTTPSRQGQPRVSSSSSPWELARPRCPSPCGRDPAVGSAELGDAPAAPSRSRWRLLLRAGRREGSGGSDSSERRSRCQIYG